MHGPPAPKVFAFDSLQRYDKDKRERTCERRFNMPIRNKADAQRALRHVPDEKRFYCHDGKILNNLYELKNALEKMNHACYIHHVTDEKNDIARWVREVLGDDKLANDLGKATSQKEASIIVKDRIVWLQEKA
jgi:hypothetical protein